ncbi:hypothetical protein D3C80_2086620 [compost metagenome]
MGDVGALLLGHLFGQCARLAGESIQHIGGGKVGDQAGQQGCQALELGVDVGFALHGRAPREEGRG